MPLDTANKRGAAINVGPIPNVVLPIPDGSIDAEDRAQLASAYAVESAPTQIVRVALSMTGRSVSLSLVA